MNKINHKSALRVRNPSVFILKPRNNGYVFHQRCWDNRSFNVVYRLFCLNLLSICPVIDIIVMNIRSLIMSKELYALGIIALSKHTCTYTLNIIGICNINASACPIILFNNIVMNGIFADSAGFFITHICLE